jgi:hypothetical protein
VQQTQWSLHENYHEQDVVQQKLQQQGRTNDLPGLDDLMQPPEELHGRPA